MKRLYIFILLISSQIFAQEPDALDYIYIRCTFDVNNAFGIIDNPRTEVEVLGYDADIEVGARDRHVGVYITYGSFAKQDYKNIALGLDYYVCWLASSGISMSAGINYGIVSRKYTRYYNPLYEEKQSPSWAGAPAIALRATTGVKIYKGLSAVATLQYQERPEFSKFVIEGAAGLQLSINR